MCEELDPLERLEYYCSTVMSPDHWLESGQYFTELENYVASLEETIYTLRNQELWLVGSLESNDTWQCEGVYSSESEARLAAKFDEVIILVDYGAIPANALDAKKLYWPNQETWLTSNLYKLRNLNG